MLEQSFGSCGSKSPQVAVVFISKFKNFQNLNKKQVSYNFIPVVTGKVQGDENTESAKDKGYVAGSSCQKIRSLWKIIILQISG